MCGASHEYNTHRWSLELEAVSQNESCSAGPDRTRPILNLVFCATHQDFMTKSYSCLMGKITLQGYCVWSRQCIWSDWHIVGMQQMVVLNRWLYSYTYPSADCPSHPNKRPGTPGQISWPGSKNSSVFSSSSAHYFWPWISSVVHDPHIFV